ncbi:MAG TPA: DUF3014 domain-containing protein [Vicinamibacterales bacterium]|nr:DUF3014 domain-containing protein [Vicinamibacterales bacterium]
MALLDDVRLDKPVEPPTEGRPRGSALVAIAAAVLITAVAAAVYVLFGRKTEQPAPAQAPAAAPAAAAPTAEAGENIPLPPLDATDPIVRKLVTELSSHPTVAAWLTTDRLLRNFVVVAINVSEGKTPTRHLKAVAPQGKFRVKSAATGAYVDPATYARYDGFAEAIDALDARGTARLYATLRPRLVEAYAEQGIPEDKVDAVLERAIVHLLETPLVDGEVPLRAKTISYAYSDERLESLSPAQKQFLRMGPRNVRVIQAKLRDLALYLGIPSARLPAPK